MKLIKPSDNIIELFNSFWVESEPQKSRIEIFESEKNGNTICIDRTDKFNAFIRKFKDYNNKDNEILKENDLNEFLKKINIVYSTRLEEEKIIGIVKKIKNYYEIDDKKEFANCNNKLNIDS